MIRFAAKELDKWLKAPNRKPLVIRGARQVGKTWLVRDLAKRQKLDLIELNFERLPNMADLFSGNDPQKILENLEAELAREIDPASSLLFLDEIQAAPELLAKLRWFREEMPELPVVAAGSLLEFALENQNYSMPVGRISYFFLEQLSFFEFVLAAGNHALYRKLASFSLDERMPESLHEKCLALFHAYCLVGGMPEAAAEWAASRDVKSCIKIQHDLLATYRDDFHKYGGEIDAAALSRIMSSAAGQLGNKFVYSRVDPDIKAGRVKKALTCLDQARVCTKVLHTSGNGLPLGAESNEKFFKVIMVDIGLVSVQLGLASTRLSKARDIVFSNKGGLAEQFVGQQLRASRAPLFEPRLYYWQRIGGRQGEIDYIIRHGSRVVPIEVKSGPSGAMKSLHQFMAEKGLDFAARCNLNLPAVEHIHVKTTLGAPVSYKLLSIPLYMAERLDELIDQAEDS